MSIRPAPHVVGWNFHLAEPLYSSQGGPPRLRCEPHPECEFHRRLGPRPPDPAEAERAVDRLVRAAREALEAERRPVMVRGKFKVQSRKAMDWGGVEIVLVPQYDTSIEEDRRYSKATPSGQITIVVDNPPASDYLALGQFFYVDFTAVPVPIPQSAPEAKAPAPESAGE